MSQVSDAVSAKLKEIRRQLEINVEIIKRDHPDPKPHTMPHIIETLTHHVYDRLNELEAALRSADAIRDEGVDGWIEWKGGECPVAGGTHVAVRLRSDAHGMHNVGLAREYEWKHYPAYASFDIIAYRVVAPPSITSIREEGN